MKYLLLFILLSPIRSLSQSRFDNTITISEFISMDRIKEVLFDYGMTITGSDSLIFETTEFKQKNDEVFIKLRIKRSENNIVIKGLMKINVSIELWGVSTPPEYEPIVFWKDKNSRPRKAFDVIDSIAKKLSEKVTYSKM